MQCLSMVFLILPPYPGFPHTRKDVGKYILIAIVYKHFSYCMALTPPMRLRTMPVYDETDKY